MLSFSIRGKKREKNGSVLGWRCRNWNFDFSRERESSFSLDFRSIGPSVFDGARRKVVLHGEGNAWALVSWSFDKLREVGVLSYSFYS